MRRCTISQTFRAGLTDERKLSGVSVGLDVRPPHPQPLLHPHFISHSTLSRQFVLSSLIQINAEIDWANVVAVVGGTLKRGMNEKTFFYVFKRPSSYYVSFEVG